jgi:hypothetical protein
MLMNRILAAVAAFCAFAGAAHAADASPRVFKPAGAWTADYGEDYCRLARSFSDGTNQISLAMERVQPNDYVRVVLVGEGIKYYRTATQMGYRFLPASDDRKTPFLKSDTPDGHQYFNLGLIEISKTPKLPEPGMPPPLYSRADEQAFAAQIDGILLTDGLTEQIELDTGALKPVIAALQSCTDDLLKYWELDVAKHQTETQAAYPDGDTSKWVPLGTIGFGDFPKLGGAANLVRLMVDANGKPTDCKIHEPSLDQATNDKICAALMKNAKFHPALDADGQPFASLYTTSPFFLSGPGFGGRRR